MGFRNSGRIDIVRQELYETFCDICGSIIPENIYPTWRLEIEYWEYKYDGDQSEIINFCSSKCLYDKAKQLVEKSNAH